MHCCITGSRVFFQYRCFNDGRRVRQQRVSWHGSGYKRGYDKGHSRGKIRNFISAILGGVSLIQVAKTWIGMLVCRHGRQGMG